MFVSRKGQVSENKVHRFHILKPLTSAVFPKNGFLWGGRVVLHNREKIGKK